MYIIPWIECKKAKKRESGVGARGEKKGKWRSAKGKKKRTS